ncbi:Proteophosphoglycan ppg4 [Rhodotorula toruloides ATCC 204091]|uniref:Proteophosphoglycan ppg4 n=1 Tax=Rhodotorula toruloides TaxID=5286 RepID=A0A0K3CFN4_RHOTO|nr:Proteophosphoglycan ppg4 [Rhodotorula toruloides ATCC 204091]KAK4333344.1 Proteophosphoglycan ppg4 [Rhodotorula toruloides]PRQ73225.1 Proteophosphoglycan ppg4 [Rhodotorula toruloides]
MADALKAKGNAAFGAQKWNDAISWWTKAIKLETDDVALASLYSNRSAAHLKVDKYDEGAEAAVLKRPTWSKALARMAEVYARQQVFDRSQQCYERAIELAEDDAARKRYEASLATTKAAEKKAEAKNAQPERPVRDGTFDDFYLTKIRLAQFRGEYVLPPEGGVALAVYAADACHEGMLQVDQNLVKVSDSQFQFTPFTDALANLCDCLVTDRSGFYLRPGRDPSFPTERKIQEIIKGELNEARCTKYFTNAIWQAKEIIADLDRRLATEGRDAIRRAVSTIIRGRIVSAGMLALGEKDRGAEVRELKLALALLEEGNRVWAHVPYKEKGNTFRSTFVRNVRVTLLKALLAAHRDLKTAAARRVYKLEHIEELANQVIQEHPPEQWIPRDGTVMRVAYSAFPVWEAYSALAYVWSERANPRLHDPPPGTLVFTDPDASKRAAEFYDKCASIMAAEAPDWHQRRFVLWLALYWRLRAGGMTVRELRARVNTAREVSLEAERFFPLESEEQYGESRKFTEMQLDSINRTMRDPPPQMSAAARQKGDRAILKPVPTMNGKGMEQEEMVRVIEESELMSLEGDIDSVDCWA